MIIDLRTQAERDRKPRKSHVQIEVPVKVTPRIREWLRNTLLEVAGAAPRGEAFDLFCASGYRATIAADILAGAGYTVRDSGPVS